MSQTQNLVSATISAESVATIRQALATAREQLPMLLTLTPDERRTLLKPSDALIAALPGLARAAKENPQYFPQEAFDADEMERDLALAAALRELRDTAASLAQALDDTVLAAESDAYRGGLAGYALLKTALRFVPGLSASVEALRAFFDRKSRKPKTEIQAQG